MKKTIGLFGGSFNPIHNGHLILANYLCEYYNLDYIWFLVTPCNPLKHSTDMLDNNIRFEMVRIATLGYSKFIASDFEFSLPVPSYTCDTLTALSKKYPDFEFVLIIGADNWAIFDKWKNYDKILKKYRIVIYPRSGYFVDRKTLPENVILSDAPLVEISSTFIRESIKNEKDIRFFLHPEVWNFIVDNSLYK